MQGKLMGILHSFRTFRQFLNEVKVQYGCFFTVQAQCAGYHTSRDRGLGEYGLLLLARERGIKDHSIQQGTDSGLNQPST